MNIKWLSKKRPKPLQETMSPPRLIHQSKKFRTKVGCRHIEVESIEDTITVSMTNEYDDSQYNMWCLDKQEVPSIIQILKEAMDAKPPAPIVVEKTEK